MSRRNDAPVQHGASVSYLDANHQDGDFVLVPPGRYSLAFNRRSLVQRFDRGVLELWFTINDFGPFFGRQLPRYYNVTISPGRRSFYAPGGSTFVREYCALFGQRPKFNCAPLKRYENVLIEGLVEDVKRDYRQKLICKEARYSTIRELRAVL